MEEKSSLSNLIMSDVQSNGFTTFVNNPDQGPYLMSRDYAFEEP